jgi:hypothetical protein
MVIKLTCVSSISHVVLDTFSNHGHCDHKYQRKNGCGRIQRGYNRYRLKNCHYQKVYVCKSLKLDKQTHWEKSYGRVLRRSYVI